MVMSSTNIPGVQGQAGTDFKFSLPNPCQQHNCLELTMIYQSGIAAPTITDNLGNTWPSTPTVSADGGAGGNVLEKRILKNINAGQGIFHVVFVSPGAFPFQYTITEWCNVDTVSPVNGTASAASITGPSLATGSFTPPANNDANGGNLISASFGLNQGTSGFGVTSWVTGGSFALLASDNWNGAVQTLPQASEYLVQAAQAAINPGMTSTGSNTDLYNAVAVALKVASAGSPKPAAGSGKIWIDRVYHFSTLGSSIPLVVKAPLTGNLHLIDSPVGNGWTPVVDSGSGSWIKRGGSGSSAIWESANRAADPNFTLTITLNNPSGQSFRIFDVSNAAVSPFEVFASAVSGTLPAGTTILNDMPDITPLTTPAVANLVFLSGVMGIGPATGFNTGAPAGAIFDLCTYPEELDGSSMENADICAHFLNTNTTLITWNFTIRSQPGGSGADACSAVYKAA